MRKLFLSIIALMFSIGLWAQETTQTVSYLYPVYNTTDDPTSGIKEWQTGTVEATVITDGSHLASFQAGWYVVTNTVVNTLSITCKGAAHLILADGAKLTVTGDSERAGIVVSGDENSLTIYGQTAQTGQLIATGSQGTGGTNDRGGAGIAANGREQSAGIGGGESGSASNITINGGTVTANVNYISTAELRRNKIGIMTVEEEIGTVFRPLLFRLKADKRTVPNSCQFLNQLFVAKYVKN